MLEVILVGNGGQVNVARYFGDFLKFELHKKYFDFFAYNTSNYSENNLSCLKMKNLTQGHSQMPNITNISTYSPTTFGEANGIPTPWTCFYGCTLKNVTGCF